MKAATLSTATSQTGERRPEDTRIKLSQALKIEARRKVVHGLRPEDLKMSPGSLEVAVQLVEPTGAEPLATLDAAGPAFHNRPDIREGASARLTVSPSKMHLVGLESGFRLSRFSFGTQLGGL